MKEDMESVRDIVIVGGSLAALLTAVILKTLPQINSITILERSTPDRLRDQGAGIRLGPEVLGTLRQYTSWPLEKYAERIDKYRVLNDAGQDIMVMETDSWCSSWGRLFHGLRKEFESTNASRSGVHTSYRTGCSVYGVNREGPGMKVEFALEGGAKESISADLVIAADGPSSTVRYLVEPETQRSYVGYVCLRGMVPSLQLSELSRSTFDHAGGFYFPPDEGQVVFYTVPSNDDDTESGTCLNWVMYQTKTEEELTDLMTDSRGTRHKYTLPAGSMREELVAVIKERAEHGISPQLTEAIKKTVQPFAHAVTDNLTGQNRYFDGKLVLVGDASAGQRPHSASALTQASFHAHLLKSMLQGKISIDTWSRETHNFSSLLIKSGHELGRILMSERLSAPARMQGYTKEFFSTQATLNGMWSELIEGNAKL